MHKYLKTIKKYDTDHFKEKESIYEKKYALPEAQPV